MRRWQIALWAGLALGCGEEPLPEGALVLSVGHELAAWEELPLAQIQVDRVSLDGVRSSYMELPGDARRFTIGQGGTTRFEATALDGEGTRILSGRTMPLVPNGLAGYELPMFVGRVGRFSRPPGELHPDAPLTIGAVVGGRHLLLFPQAVDGTVDPSGYDFGVWLPHATAGRLGCPEAPCRFESVLVSGTFLVAISSRWGIWFDLVYGGSGNLPLDGLSGFDELAGGAGVETPDGDAYLVGGTREGEPTNAVLHLTDDGVVDVLRLFTPRAGAAASWVPDRGLVVAGGSAEGSGAELLPIGGETFVPLELPPDPTRGAGLAAIDATRVLRAGGTLDGSPAETVVLPLDCNDCAPEPHSAAIDLTAARAFMLGEDDFLIAGTDPDGSTAVVRLQAGELTPEPLREPRRQAVVLLGPTEQLLVAGGELSDGSGAATRLELFTP